jgi:hypothetical protein
LLFITSAQTHIFSEIRIDAVRFLDLFFEALPSVVIDAWNDGSGGQGSRILEGYLGVLQVQARLGEVNSKFVDIHMAFTETSPRPFGDYIDYDHAYA